MAKEKCSDYFCARIPFYPKKIMDANSQQNAHIAQQMIQKHVDFKDLFLQYVFDKPFGFFHKNYGCFTSEAINEFLEIWHGIRICEFESGYYHYLIPIQYVELIDWMKLNWPDGTKQMLRFSIPLHKNTAFYFAEKAHQFTIDMYRKNPKYLEIFGAIEELTLADKIELS